LPILGEFPVWGTGYGTFLYVERRERKNALSADLIFDHAHNDYLELFVEGGIFALGLGLFAIGAIYHSGITAVRSRRHPATAGLVAGTMLGITTLVLHSIGDFGTHIPAITLLATVMAAQVCAQGRSSSEAGRGRPVESRNGKVHREYRVRLWGLAPVCAAIACVALAAILCAAGWKSHVVYRLMVAADEAAISGMAQAQQERIAYLTTAASLAPDDVELLAHLGNVGLREYDLQRAKLRHGTELAWEIAAWPNSLLIAPNPAQAAAQLCGLVEKVEEARLVRTLVMPALRAYLQARDICPLCYEVQLGIGANVAHLATADAQGEYLHRAQLAAPGDPEVWYLSGLLQLEAKQMAESWSCWNRCLELSDRYLTRILDRSARTLSSEEIVAKVFPARPDRLLAAAVFLGPNAPDEKRLPFLEKALNVISTQATPLAPPDLYTKVQVQLRLDQTAEGLETYRALVKSDPKNVKYRFEFAQFLFDQGKLQEARAELLVVQAQDPGHRDSRHLLATVEKAILDRK
jgi:tetratricopeptide (TPR) repeat protein